MIGIYKITSPVGRIYIGQSINIEKRFKNHLGLKGDSKIQTSFKLHGFLNHRFEILEQCDVSELNNRERYWQDYYNVFSKEGLNVLITNDRTKPYNLGWGKPINEIKGTEVTHELIFNDMLLNVIGVYHEPDIKREYVGGFHIREIFLNNKYFLWTLSKRAKDRIVEEITKKYY